MQRSIRFTESVAYRTDCLTKISEILSEIVSEILEFAHHLRGPIRARFSEKRLILLRLSSFNETTGKSFFVCYLPTTKFTGWIASLVFCSKPNSAVTDFLLTALKLDIKNGHWMHASKVLINILQHAKTWFAVLNLRILRILSRSTWLTATTGRKIQNKKYNNVFAEKT